MHRKAGPPQRGEGPAMAQSLWWGQSREARHLARHPQGCGSHPTPTPSQAPPHSPEPGSPGGTVLPMLGRRYSMLGTD